MVATWFTKSMATGVFISIVSAISWFYADKFTGQIYLDRLSRIGTY